MRCRNGLLFDAMAHKNSLDADDWMLCQSKMKIGPPQSRVCSTTSILVCYLVRYVCVFFRQPTSIIISPFASLSHSFSSIRCVAMCVCAHCIWICASTFMFVRLSGARVTINAVSQALDIFEIFFFLLWHVLANTGVFYMQEWRRRGWWRW